MQINHSCRRNNLYLDNITLDYLRHYLDKIYLIIFVRHIYISCTLARHLCRRGKLAALVKMSPTSSHGYTRTAVEQDSFPSVVIPSPPSSSQHPDRHTLGAVA